MYSSGDIGIYTLQGYLEIKLTENGVTYMQIFQTKCSGSIHVSRHSVDPMNPSVFQVAMMFEVFQGVFNIFVYDSKHFLNFFYPFEEKNYTFNKKMICNF